MTGITLFTIKLSSLHHLDSDKETECRIGLALNLRSELCKHSSVFVLKKEVIQPHLPIGLPCYDFIPVISLTFGASSLAVKSATSGKTNFHDVTGGVYKARERIHDVIADTSLLAIPTSRSRVADFYPN